MHVYVPRKQDFCSVQVWEKTSTKANTMIFKRCMFQCFPWALLYISVTKSVNVCEHCVLGGVSPFDFNPIRRKQSCSFHWPDLHETFVMVRICTRFGWSWFKLKLMGAGQRLVRFASWTIVQYKTCVHSAMCDDFVTDILKVLWSLRIPYINGSFPSPLALGYIFFRSMAKYLLYGKNFMFS